MSDREKWDHAVQKLIALTDKGEVKWQHDPFAEERQRDDTEIIGAAYSAVVAGRMICVYEYAYAGPSSSGEDEDTTDVAIEFTGGSKLLWRWPQTLHRWELLESVRGQVAGADEFLETFLANEIS